MSTYNTYMQDMVDMAVRSQHSRPRRTESDLEILLGMTGTRRRATESRSAQRWRDVGLLAVVISVWTPFLTVL